MFGSGVMSARIMVTYVSAARWNSVGLSERNPRNVKWEHISTPSNPRAHVCLLPVITTSSAFSSVPAFRPPVSALLLVSGPADIAWLVVSVVVDTVDRHALGTRIKLSKPLIE